MEKLNLGKHQPSCMLAHHFVNKLTVIVGGCDLLTEKSEPDSELSKRLLMMREIAKSMADELNQHQCHLDAMVRVGEMQQATKYSKI